MHLDICRCIIARNLWLLVDAQLNRTTIHTLDLVRHSEFREGEQHVILGITFDWISANRALSLLTSTQSTRVDALAALRPGSRAAFWSATRRCALRPRALLLGRITLKEVDDSIFVIASFDVDTKQ